MPQAIANRHSPIDNPADWVSIDDAARLLGMSSRHVRRLAAASLARGLSRLAPPTDGPGKPVWWLHRSIHARLGVPAPDTREARARDTLLSRFPQPDVNRAYRKAYWMKEWRSRCAAPRVAWPSEAPPCRTAAGIAAEIAAEAKQHEGPDFLISVRTLQAWWTAYNAIGDDGRIRGVEALVDRYGCGTAAPGGESTRSASAINFFYGLFRTERKLTLKVCHEITQRESRRERWAWPPSASATARWLRDYDDIPLTFLCRYGRTLHSKKYMPYSEQDWDLVAPGTFYVCDHHQVDFWVRYKDHQIRPWLTAVQDCGSRRIAGWHLGPAPHQEAILVALRMAFREAIPEVMRVDNGKDFTAKALTGLTKMEARALRRDYGPQWKAVVRKSRDNLVCDDPRWRGIVAELGVELILAKRYSPWSKGTLERFFRTFEDQCGKLFNTYCGHTPSARPESLQLIRDGYTGRGVDPLALVDGSAVPTLEGAAAAIGDYLTVYHAAAQRGEGMNGRAPLAAWNAAPRLRKPVEGELDCLISVRGEYTVGPNGVHLTVCGKHLGYGARTAGLRPWIGRKILVSVDPEYPARCVAYETGNHRQICVLNPNKRIHPLAKSDDLREASAAVNRNRKDMVDYAKKSARRTLDVSAVLDRDRREQAAALRATGTDDVRPNIVPVRGGFAGRSIPAQTWIESASTRDVVPGDLSELLSGEVRPPEPDWDCADLLSEPSPQVDGQSSEIDGFL